MSKKKVQVWIYWKDPFQKTLYFLALLTRPDRRHFWQPVTGSVEKDETLIHAAIREAQEETGLTFAGVPEELGEVFEYESRGAKVTEHGFLLEALAPKEKLPEVRLDPHEHVEYRWVESKTAMKMIAYPSNLHMLETALGRLKLRDING